MTKVQPTASPGSLPPEPKSLPFFSGRLFWAQSFSLDTPFRFSYIHATPKQVLIMPVLINLA